MPIRFVFILLVLAGLTGCGAGLSGPRVRFATATEQQLQAVQAEDIVWYEFRQGDEVPLHFVLVGVAEGENDKPIALRAKRTFYLVTFKNRPPAFSFDGKSIVTQDSGKVGITLGRIEGANRAAVVVFVGQQSDMPPDLQQAFQRK
jgi:hypothetical protein